MRHYTTLYNVIQDYTTIYKAIQHYIRLYDTKQHYATLYNSIQDYTTLYKAIRHISGVTQPLGALRQSATFGPPLLHFGDLPPPHFSGNT